MFSMHTTPENLKKNPSAFILRTHRIFSRPAHFRRRKIKSQQMACHFGFAFEENLGSESRDKMRSWFSKSSVFETFSSARKCKGGVFKLFRFDERFHKLYAFHLVFFNIYIHNAACPTWIYNSSTKWYWLSLRFYVLLLTGFLNGNPKKNVNVKFKCKFNVRHRNCLRNHPSQRRMIKCLRIPDRIGIWKMLVFEEKGKLDYPEKNLLEQGREPTTDSTHIWRRVRESNQGHRGGKRALSSLRHPCSVN